MITSRRAPARRTARADDDPRSPRAEWLGCVLLVTALFVFFAQLYPRRNWSFGVGPDGPVYLWWTRLAGHDGLSAVAGRPGIPALALVLRGSIRSSLVEALAAIGVVGGVCVGLAAGALVWLGTDGSVGSTDRRLRSVGAAVLAGTFAVHLADGYLANLIQAALFLAAAALLAVATTRATVAAGVLLAASALTHPDFFALSALILGLTALPTVLRRPPGAAWRDVEGSRIAAALAGGGALAGIGFASLLSGPRPLRVDTSEDAFLRRAGLVDVLRHQYRGRFSRHLGRYILPLQAPFAVGGLLDNTGFLGRFLSTWGVVSAVGVIGAAVTAIIPAVRLFAFAYVLPILAAIGLVRLYRWIARRNRVVAAVVSAGLALGIVSGAAITWTNAEPFVGRGMLERAAIAGQVAERTVPPGTPLVFLVDTSDKNIGFLAVRALNVVRAAMPPDRIRDAYIYVGSPAAYLVGRPTIEHDQLHDAMSRVYLRDIRRAGGHPLAFVLATADREHFHLAKLRGDLVARGVVVLKPHPVLGAALAADAGPPPEAAPSSGWRIALFSLAALLVLTAIGLGWAGAVVRGPAALALAPGLGAGGVILGAILLDRLGVPMSGWGAPVVSAALAGGGYLAMLRTRRADLTAEGHTRGEPGSQIA